MSRWPVPSSVWCALGGVLLVMTFYDRCICQSAPVADVESGDSMEESTDANSGMGNDLPASEPSPWLEVSKRLNSGWGPSITYYGAWRIPPTELIMYNNTTRPLFKGRPGSKLCYISPIACFGRRIQTRLGMPSVGNS